MKRLLFLGIDLTLMVLTALLVNEKLGWAMALIWAGWCANVLYSAYYPRVYVVLMRGKDKDEQD